MICKIAEPHEMPVDADGNRADMIMDGNSTVNRMNVGRLYEQYINGASRDVAKKIRNDLGIKQKDIHTKTKVEQIFYDNNALFTSTYNYLMGYYNIISQKMFNWLNDTTDAEKIGHLASVVKDNIYLYMPTDIETEYTEIVKNLEKHYPQTYGPVTYTGNSGVKVMTKDPVRIGSMYIIMLEKTGDDWASVSSGKLQHFGILSQLTKQDKYSQPTRMQPVRAIGESEARIIVSYVGVEGMAEIMDRNNTPRTHKEMVSNILSAKTATNIQNVIDREEYPLGGPKPLSIVNHFLLCAGMRFVYDDQNSGKSS